MNCRQCGTENDPAAASCTNCGAALTDHDAQQAAASAPEVSGPALWNPSATVNWSLIFTPAFGAYLQMLNWRALGESGKAIWSAIWFYASLGMLALYVYMSAFSNDPMSEDKVAHGLGFTFLLVWYFLFGKDQGVYVKKKLGKRYARNSWGKPLLFGLGGWIAFYLATVIVKGLGFN